MEVDWGLTSHQTQVISGTGFCESKYPTDSVRTLKDDSVLRIRLQSHGSTPPCYNNTTNIQYEKTRSTNA